MLKFDVKILFEGKKEFEETVEATCAWAVIEKFKKHPARKPGRTLKIDPVPMSSIEQELDNTLEHSKKKRKEIKKWLARK